MLFARRILPFYRFTSTYVSLDSASFLGLAPSPRRRVERFTTLLPALVGRMFTMTMRAFSSRTADSVPNLWCSCRFPESNPRPYSAPARPEKPRSIAAYFREKPRGLRPETPSIDALPTRCFASPVARRYSAMSRKVFFSLAWPPEEEPKLRIT